MRGQTAQPGCSIRQGRLVRGVWCSAAMVIVALGGCGVAAAGSQIQVSQVAPAAPGPGQASPTAPPDATSDAPAADVMSAIADALDALAASAPTPDSEALRTAFDSAGVDPAAVEVSVDVTPTGLEVDAMTAAAPVGGACIFGHIREGVATVIELPVLSDGRCFVGDQR